MTIYIDLVIFINFMFDFDLLLSLNMLLKRRTKIWKIVIGSLIGSLSLLTLFLNLNSLMLFIFKFLISVVMILVTFKNNSRQEFIDNMVYLYLLSIILGGTLYLLNDHFSYKSSGLIFINKDYNINLIIILIITPLLLIGYNIQLKKFQLNYSKYYKLDILLSGKIINLTAFLDTGNKLIDPITKKPIIIINQNVLSDNYHYFFVPYTTINGSSILKCIKPDYIVIDNKVIKNVLVGISEQPIKIPGVDCILNERIFV